MPEFNAVENTLFIPMLGRIYASEHFQNILYDEKALSLKDALPIGYELTPMSGGRSEVLSESLTFAITGMERITHEPPQP